MDDFLRYWNEVLGYRGEHGDMPKKELESGGCCRTPSSPQSYA